jgi:hypothetical protein
VCKKLLRLFMIEAFSVSLNHIALLTYRCLFGGDSGVPRGQKVGRWERLFGVLFRRGRQRARIVLVSIQIGKPRGGSRVPLRRGNRRRRCRPFVGPRRRQRCCISCCYCFFFDSHQG